MYSQRCLRAVAPSMEHITTYTCLSFSLTLELYASETNGFVENVLISCINVFVTIHLTVLFLLMSRLGT